MPEESKPENQTKQTSGEKIGEYVNYQRLKRGWSLNEFAKRSGMTPSFVHRLEQGQYGTLKLSAVEQLAKGFSMTLFSFLAKCQIISRTSTELPSLEYFLKEQYHLPPVAIEDVTLFLSFIRQKYSQEIFKMEQAHEDYWRAQKDRMRNDS